MIAVDMEKTGARPKTAKEKKPSVLRSLIVIVSYQTTTATTTTTTY